MEILNPCTEDEVTPTVPIKFDEEIIVLHFFNTRLRTFPDEQFNHTEFIDAEGETQATTSRELMDLLFELNFPMLSMPYVDGQTMDWFIMMESQDLEGVDPDFFGNGTEDTFG